MCIGVYGKINKIEYPNAIVDINGVSVLTNIELIEKPHKGDYVLIHAGFAIEKLDKKNSEEINKIIFKMFEESTKIN